MEYFNNSKLTKTVLRNADIGFYSIKLNQDGYPQLYPNETFVKLLGIDKTLTPEEIYQFWFDNIDNEYRDKIRDVIADIMDNRHITARYKWHHPDGVLKFYQISADKITDENGQEQLIGCLQDITEYSLFEQNKDDQYFQIIQNLASEYSSVFYVDLDTDDLTPYSMDEDISNEFGLIFNSGINYSAALDMFVDSRVYNDDKQKVLEIGSLENICQELSDKKSFTRIFRCYKSESTDILYYEVKFVKYGFEYEPPRQVTVAIANKDALIRNEQQRQQELLDARAHAEEASEAKSRFLFNMSHDIRTPMNAIMGFSKMAIEHQSDTEKVKDCLGKIQLSGQHLLKLINDVLDMSRIESGKVILEEKSVNIIEAANDLLFMVKEGANTNQLNLNLNIHHLENPIVYADILHVNQILLNILSNAIKYTKPGGSVTFTIVQTESMHEGYGAYNFIFEDTGIGMSEEFVSHIYETFARERSSTVSGIDGFGLGMSIAKSLTEQMGGKIDIASELGVGTTVNVHLEFRLPPQSEMSLRKISAESLDINFEGKRVLLVEDNELNREIAHDILEMRKLVIEEANDGSVAVDKIKSLPPDYYDFVLMDIQMPYMDGYTATKTIRSLKNADYSKLPIIAMTANAFEEDKKNAFEAGMNAHVPKPIDVDELFTTLSQFIKA